MSTVLFKLNKTYLSISKIKYYLIFVTCHFLVSAICPCNLPQSNPGIKEEAKIKQKKQNKTETKQNQRQTKEEGEGGKGGGEGRGRGRRRRGRRRRRKRRIILLLCGNHCVDH